MLQGWDLNSRDTRDMKNNMEARTYAHTHIVLAKVQYEENRPAHLVLHTRDKQLKSLAMILAEAWPTLADKRQREIKKQACSPRM